MGKNHLASREVSDHLCERCNDLCGRCNDIYRRGGWEDVSNWWGRSKFNGMWATLFAVNCVCRLVENLKASAMQFISRCFIMLCLFTTSPL